jgi:hypothetical protein
LFLNRLELLAPPFVSRQKIAKRKKQPLKKDRSKRMRESLSGDSRANKRCRCITVVGENTNNGVVET